MITIDLNQIILPDNILTFLTNWRFNSASKRIHTQHSQSNMQIAFANTYNWKWFLFYCERHEIKHVFSCIFRILVSRLFIYSPRWPRNKPEFRSFRTEFTCRLNEFEFMMVIAYLTLYGCIIIAFVSVFAGIRCRFI